MPEEEDGPDGRPSSRLLPIRQAITPRLGRGESGRLARLTEGLANRASRLETCGGCHSTRFARSSRRRDRMITRRIGSWRRIRIVAALYQDSLLAPRITPIPFPISPFTTYPIEQHCS
jgi:hypothetical protein